MDVKTVRALPISAGEYEVPSDKLWDLAMVHMRSGTVSLPDAMQKAAYDLAHLVAWSSGDTSIEVLEYEEFSVLNDSDKRWRQYYEGKLTLKPEGEPLSGGWTLSVEAETHKRRVLMRFTESGVWEGVGVDLLEAEWRNWQAIKAGEPE